AASVAEHLLVPFDVGVSPLHRGGMSGVVVPRLAQEALAVGQAGPGGVVRESESLLVAHRPLAHALAADVAGGLLVADGRVETAHRLVPLRPRPTSGGEGVGELDIEVAGRERGQAVLLGGRAGVHDDVALTAVQGAELAGVAGLASVGLALDRSRHGEPPEVRGHQRKWAAQSSVEIEIDFSEVAVASLATKTWSLRSETTLPSSS